MAKSDPHEIAPDSLFHGLQATRSYTDLMFAFGFARLGDTDTAEQLRTDAGNELDSIPVNREFHRLARSAFECRISEALRGEPHIGPLDDRCPEVIAALLHNDFASLARTLEGMIAYQLGQVIHFSAILEPECYFNPYFRFSTGGAAIAWIPRDAPSTEWRPLIETAESHQAIWNAVRTDHEANDPHQADAYSNRGRYNYCQQLPKLLAAVRSLPLNVVRRFLTVILTKPPRVNNTFTTAPFFSRLHYAVADPLVLAVVGTGPLPSDAERPERRELLRFVRPSVLKWIQAMA